jgi:hypothetical protein
MGPRMALSRSITVRASQIKSWPFVGLVPEADVAERECWAIASNAAFVIATLDAARPSSSRREWRVSTGFWPENTGAGGGLSLIARCAAAKCSKGYFRALSAWREGALAAFRPLRRAFAARSLLCAPRYMEGAGGAPRTAASEPETNT